MSGESFSDLREDGDMDEYTVDRSAFTGQGFDEDDRLGGYGEHVSYPYDYEDAGSDIYSEEEDDDGQWSADERAPRSIQRTIHSASDWVGPEEEEEEDRRAVADDYVYEPVMAPVKSRKKELPWEKRQITFTIEGSINKFHDDPASAAISLEDVLAGTAIFATLQKSKDFLGEVSIIKGRNTFPVTIGVAGSLQDDKNNNKLQGELISKKSDQLLLFDMYPKASITAQNPETILKRPKYVRRPILAAYKNHTNPTLRKYADPANIDKGISENPSSDDTCYVSAKHPVMVELKKAAKRRCAAFGKRYDEPAIFGKVHGGNYTVLRTDVEQTISKLLNDYSRVSYLSDITTLTLSLTRTQLNTDTSRNRLKTNWKDACEIGTNLLGTQDGMKQLEQRYDALHAVYLTVQYEFLPQDAIYS